VFVAVVVAAGATVVAGAADVVVETGGAEGAGGYAEVPFTVSTVSNDEPGT
jgi:hypothetical protein